MDMYNGYAAVANESVLTRKQVATRLGISTATLDRWVKAGDFPPPIKLSRFGRRVGFLRSVVDARLTQ